MRVVEDFDLLGLDAETMRDPYPFYRLLLEDAPVFKEPKHGVFIVSRYDDIMEMKRQPHRFSNRQATGPMTLPKLEDLPADVRERIARMLGAGAAADPSAQPPQPPLRTLLAADPPDHGRYRGMTNRLLNVRRAKQWEPRIRAIADELIDAFIDRGELEWVMDFGHPLALRTVAEVLGVPQGDDKLLAEMFGGPNAGEAIGNPHVMVERMLEGANAARPTRPTFVGFFTDRIKEMRARPVEGDFLSDLLEMPDANGIRLDDAEVLSIISHFQVAGHETSTKMMTQAMYQLVTHPEAMAEVRADPSLCENLIEEALRYEAPVQGLFQIANEDIEIGGVLVPAESMIMTLYGAANRDPRHFDNPDRFDLHRANARTHLSFGQGIHFCVGSPFARAEGKHGFQAFFERIADVRFAPGKNTFERTVSYVLRGIREMHLEFTRA